MATPFYTNHPDVVKVGKAAFPNYTGKSFKVAVADGPISVKSYWDGGSRNYFCFVRLSDLQASVEIPAQSMFDKQIPGADQVILPPGLVCVEHSICCGKDYGISIYYHPDNAPKMIEEKVELNLRQFAVLYATRAYKSHYNGRNARLYEINRAGYKMSLEEFEQIKLQLVEKGLLKRNGGITDIGRNVSRDTWSLPPAPK